MFWYPSFKEKRYVFFLPVVVSACVVVLLRNTPGPGWWAQKLQIEMETEMHFKLWVGAQDKRLWAASLWDNKGHEDGGCQPGKWILRDTAGASQSQKLKPLALGVWLSEYSSFGWNSHTYCQNKLSLFFDKTGHCVLVHCFSASKLHCMSFPK